IGLDLGNALIQGDLDLSRLSLRVSPYGGPVLPALEAFTQAITPYGSASYDSASYDSASYGSASGLGALVSPSLQGPTRTGTLLRSLLIKPQAMAMDTFAFQGPLLLEQTCFNGMVTAANLYFLNRLEAAGVIFTQPVDWRGAHFARSVDFSQGQFQQESTFRMALFAARAKFNQARFSGLTNWEGATFHEAVSFAGASFKSGDFSRSHWQANADFEQAGFHEPITFQKSRFDQSLFLTDAQFEAAANFRQAQFQSAISLRGAHILNPLDFGDARFAKATTINVADLDFNAGEAKILGSPGYIGRVFSVPALASNETVLRNLVRNFRLLEQVSDANQVEYTTERLRLKGLKRQMLGLSLNQTSATQLVKLGLSADQAAAVVARVQTQPFVSRTDLLGLAEIDLASYLKVRDRITTKPTDILHRTQRFIRWLLLAGLLLLSQYGTNVGLTFGVGLLATTAFAVIFWIVDRYRRQVPTPILPTQVETVSMALGSAGLFFLSLTLIGQSNLHPGWTLIAVAFVVLPVPLVIMARLYQQGRYH
ncbi:MAG: pentapeptide repeat-containing protein, partial [Cyanobacteria bacterium J06555_13]